MTCKIVAEVGSNFRDFEDCKNSIALAKQCGADAVKFQAFTPEALYGMNCIDIKSLPLDWLPKLAEKAKACGIEFMCTAFSPELVEAVNPFVQAHKIASAELTHVRLLEAVRKTNKPVYLSTGASGMQDIENALEVLKGSDVTLMHCVAAYPARASNLVRIGFLRDRYKVPVGYSDHSISCDDIPFQAVHSYGATVLEKHFTIIPEVATPDQPHSLTVDQFKRMVQYVRGLFDSLQMGLVEEQGMILRHNRRLIATREIHAGEIMKENENFGIYRALQDEPAALSPWTIDEVNGRSARRAIQAGRGINPEDV